MDLQKYDDKWGNIVRLHNLSKELLLIAEETGFEFRTFFQPLIEQRSALEHIVRAEAGRLGARPEAGEDYIISNLDKALGHEYRAFFDIADWLSLTLREAITEQLKPYSNEAIQAALPDYYPIIKPMILRLSLEIAEARAAKDIAAKGVILPVDEYYNIVKELLGFYEKTLGCIPALEEWKAKGRRANLKDLGLKCLLVVMGGVLTAIVRWLWH